MLGARAGTNDRKERKERVTDAIQQMGLEEKSENQLGDCPVANREESQRPEHWLSDQD